MTNKVFLVETKWVVEGEDALSALNLVLTTNPPLEEFSVSRLEISHSGDMVEVPEVSSNVER